MSILTCIPQVVHAHNKSNDIKSLPLPNTNMDTPAVFETAYYTSSTYLFGQKVVYSMLYCM